MFDYIRNTYLRIQRDTPFRVYRQIPCEWLYLIGYKNSNLIDNLLNIIPYKALVIPFYYTLENCGFSQFSKEKRLLY